MYRKTRFSRYHEINLDGMFCTGKSTLVNPVCGTRRGIFVKNDFPGGAAVSDSTSSVCRLPAGIYRNIARRNRFNTPLNLHSGQRWRMRGKVDSQSGSSS